MRKTTCVLAGVLVASLTLVGTPASAQGQENLAPVAIATVEETTEATETAPAVVTLDGSDSFDPGASGAIARYEWEVLTEAYQWLELTQANRQSPTATFEVPVQRLVERVDVWSIEFRLTVTDNGRPALSDSVTVEYRINQRPVVDIEVSAKLLDRDDETGYDDNRNGAVDENEERYTIEGVAARRGELGNADNEWDVRAATLLELDASGSFDPDGELSDSSFHWELWRTHGAESVRASLPIGVEGNTVEGQRMLSTDEDPNTPDNSGNETVARLPFESGRGTVPFLAWYRVTVTDEDGASTTEIVKIVFEDFHDNPEVEIAHPESDPDALTEEDRREGVLPAGEDRYVISPEAAERGVTLVATGGGDGSGRTAALAHNWSGTGVTPSDSNQPGPRSEAVFKAPLRTEEGETFAVAVEVVDPDGLRSSTSIELVVAETLPPSATAPDDIDTPDGIDGGWPPSDPPSGFVMLQGIGFDPDGDEIAYDWDQVLNASGDPLGVAYAGPRISLANSDTPNSSFRLFEVTRGALATVYVQLTVTDEWGVTATDIVEIIIRDGDDDLEARAGPDQQVPSGGFVRLTGRTRAGLLSEDVLDRVIHQWAYTGIETDPPLELRPPLAPREIDQGFASDGWFPNADGTYDSTAGGRLKNTNSPFAYFDAPELHDFNAVRLTFELTVSYSEDDSTDSAAITHTDSVTITVLSETGLRYFSGAIDGLDHCTTLSLGGPLTRPYDSDDDGVADVCSLIESRRAAIARQIALEQLAILNQDAFHEALFGIPDDPDTEEVDESVAGTCATAPVDLGDTDEALLRDVCGLPADDPRAEDPVPPVPDPLNYAYDREFYSGAVTSPTYCANLSLGGPTRYPTDDNGDGVADRCALPWTRREAVARHNALAAAFSDHPQFPAALAAACTSLGTLDFGEPPEVLAEDACNPDPADFGDPLPTPDSSN